MWLALTCSGFLNKFGFYIEATNGTFAGNKTAALSKSNLKYNYKFNLDLTTHAGTDYFDETLGFLIADFDYVKFKIGRDRKIIGYGKNNYIVSDNAPPMDYVSLDINYKFLNFSYFHGKLLGTSSIKSDSIEGELRTVTDKFIAYHRFGFH